MYIDFEFYCENGGKVTDQTAFATLERRAGKEMDYYTFNRLKDVIPTPDDVKYAMVELINLFYDVSQAINHLSSFGNDGVNGAFTTQFDANKQAFDIISRYVPREYLYLGVE